MIHSADCEVVLSAIRIVHLWRALLWCVLFDVANVSGLTRRSHGSFSVLVLGPCLGRAILLRNKRSDSQDFGVPFGSRGKLPSGRTDNRQHFEGGDEKVSTKLCGWFHCLGGNSGIVFILPRGGKVIGNPGSASTAEVKGTCFVTTGSYWERAERSSSVFHTHLQLQTAGQNKCFSVLVVFCCDNSSPATCRQGQIQGHAERQPHLDLRNILVLLSV